MGGIYRRFGAICIIGVTLLPVRGVSATDSPSLRPDGPPRVAGLQVLAGNLHDHSTDSDGDAPSQVVARWFKAHHRELGVDFETLTDHSDFFPLAPLGPVAKPVWPRQAALVKNLTGDGMSFLRGFEWTNDQQNHINVIGSQNWTSRFATGDAAFTMAPFWAWLATLGKDGVGQFNHPSEKGYLNWDDYKLNAAAAKRMATIEIVGARNKTAADLMNSDAGWYWFALSKGWNVSPAMNYDFHDWVSDGVLANKTPGANCGAKGYLTCQRTLVLAHRNTPASIEEALRRRRTSASELPDLWATLRGPRNTWQGSTTSARPGEEITLTVDAGSATQELLSVDIVTDGGIDPHPYFDGDNDRIVHDQLTPSAVVQKARFVATDGHTTRKIRHDAAPRPALIATVPLSGHRATKQITVRVPSVRSHRPDGKHFFYAVVHATPPAEARGTGVTARAWTGPLFTTGVPTGQWIAGDTHVHDDHSSDGSAIRQGVSQGAPGNVSVADQIGQAERAGLGFLTLTDHRTYDQHWDPLWRSDKLILVPGEEANGSPHANVHGAADEVVDGANPADSAPYRHIQQSIWDVHAQNASWQTNHPDDGEFDDRKPNANASAVGVDTVEVWNRGSDVATEIAYAENRWNAGFRFGVTGASDNHFKELWPLAGPGTPTTFVFAPQATERGVVAGLRSGRTTVSANPLGPMAILTADVDGDGAFESIGGDEVTTVAGAKATLKVRIKRGVGTTVRVYAAPGATGAPVATFRPTKLDQAFTLPLGTAAWYRAEVRGVGGPPGVPTDNPEALADFRPHDALLALTSPLFVDGGGRAAPRAEMPLPAAIAKSDAATAAISEPGAFAGFVDIARGRAATHVVAEVGGGRVAYQRLTADGTRTVGERITLSDPDDTARFPSVAAHNDDVYVVWQHEREPQTPHRTNVVLRHSGDGGTSWDDPVAVTTSGNAQHPTIAVTPTNHPVIAWQDNGKTGAFDIYVRDLISDRAPINLSAAGKTVRQGSPLDSRSAIHPASLFPALAVGNNGRIAVAWQDNRRDIDPGWTGSIRGEGTAPDDWEVFVATRALGGVWGNAVNVSNDPKRADRHASIDFTGGQDVLIAAWDSKELKESDVNLNVRYAQAPATGIGWTAPRQVGFDPAAMSQHPQVAATGEGARIIWYDSRSADWRWSLWSADLTPAGAGAPRRLTGTGNALYPAVAGSLIAFTSDRAAARSQRDPTFGIFVLPA